MGIPIPGKEHVSFSSIMPLAFSAPQLLISVILVPVLANPLCTQEVEVHGHGALLQVGTRRHARGISTPMTVELKRKDDPTGIMMPRIGLGAAQGPTLQASIATFLEHGGQLIDTAISYGQQPVGDALRNAIDTKGMERDQFWVTSKILPDAANSSEQTLALVDQSLEDLHLKHIDLFLIHWPGDSVERMVEIWKGLIAARDAGKVRVIGVSNFTPEQIAEIEKATGERPAVNQFQYHPWVSEEVHENVQWCQDHGVAVTAYGSLGGQYHTGLTNPKVLEVAAKHGMTAAQVLLRWALHQGVSVIPGATSEQHIVENLDVANFKLSAEEAEQSFFTK